MMWEVLGTGTVIRAPCLSKSFLIMFQVLVSETSMSLTYLD